MREPMPDPVYSDLTGDAGRLSHGSTASSRSHSIIVIRSRLVPALPLHVAGFVQTTSFSTVMSSITNAGASAGRCAGCRARIRPPECSRVGAYGIRGSLDIVRTVSLRGRTQIERGDLRAE